MFSRKAFSARLHRNQISPADRSSLPCRTYGIGGSSDRVVHGTPPESSAVRRKSAGQRQSGQWPEKKNGFVRNRFPRIRKTRSQHNRHETRHARNTLCILSGTIAGNPESLYPKKASAPAQKRAKVDTPILIRPKQAFSYPQAAVSKAFARSRTGPSSRSGRAPIARSVPPEFRHS